MLELIPFFMQKPMIKNMLKMAAAYVVFFILLGGGSLKTALIVFMFFCIIQIPLYLIARCCVQRSFLSTFIFLALYYFLKKIMENPETFDYYWYSGRSGGEAIIRYVFFAPDIAWNTILIIALIAHIILKYSNKMISNYAAERTIRSINYFWWILPIFSVIFQHKMELQIVPLILLLFMIAQYFYYKYHAKRVIKKAETDTEAKEMIFYTSMNNILLNSNSDHFISIGRLLFGTILGNVDHHHILTDTISKIYRIFPYEYVRFHNTHPFQNTVKKFILYIDTKDISLCSNKRYANMVLNQLKKLLANNLEIMVISTASKKLLSSTYFEDELLKSQLEYKWYPSRKEINYTDIEYFIYSQELNDTEKKIRQTIWDLNASLPEENKFSFLHYQLKTIHKTFNSTELFYQLLRIIEFVLHYRALYVLSTSDKETMQNFDSFSIGGWANLQYQLEQAAPKYMEGDPVHKAYLVVMTLLKKTKLPNSCKFDDVIQAMIELRNKYLGHGSITYSVSDQLLEALMELTKEIVIMFQHDVSRLSPSTYIILKADNKGKRIPCYLEDDSLLSYWIHDEEASFEEYLNYQTGLVKRDGNAFTIMLSMEGGL